MEITIENILTTISKIREEIGHENIEPDITDVIYDEEKKELLIITSDRPEKSLVIGKGGWVVGKLREELKVNQIHVEAYSDILIRKYRMNLAKAQLKKVMANYDEKEKKLLSNLSELLKRRIANPYSLDVVLNESVSPKCPKSVTSESSKSISSKYLKSVTSENSNSFSSENPNSFSSENSNSFSSEYPKTVVALSGGVDSSFSLIIADMMGFNPIAVTVNPGDIILPRHFRERVEKLSEKLGVGHQYLDVDSKEVVEGALEGRYHPCGRCSKLIEKAVHDYSKKINAKFVIFGDLLATGAQSFVYNDEILRINLPAMLSATKGETKALAEKYGVSSVGGYGCPLLAEVKKKYSQMNRFSVQRILRETRAGILEPGEALDMVMSLCRNRD